jgi:hypothetical protein
VRSFETVQRQVGDLFTTDGEALVGGGGFNERHFGFDRDRLGGGADFERDAAEVENLVGVELDIGTG